MRKRKSGRYDAEENCKMYYQVEVEPWRWIENCSAMVQMAGEKVKEQSQKKTIDYQDCIGGEESI